MKSIYKQEIEEMAKILCGTDWSCKDCRFRKQCFDYDIAQAFYNGGCRKVTKESVEDVPQSS